MATNPFHRWLIQQRVFCEHSSRHRTCLHHGATVENLNGRDTVLCNEHASRLANVRRSEKAFELKEAKTKKHLT